MAAEIYSAQMNEDEFKLHTKKIALRVFELIDQLPNSDRGRVLGNQLLDSASSIASDYRLACGETSNQGLIEKLSRVEHKTEKTLFLLELAVESGMLRSKTLLDLTGDLDEILSRTSSSIQVLRKR